MIGLGESIYLEKANRKKKNKSLKIKNDERTKLLRGYYGQSITVVGIVAGVRKTNKDKRDNIENNNDASEARKNGQCTNPIYFPGNMTLIKNVTVQGSKKIIDHVWIAEDLLELLKASIGDKVQIRGVVREYKKHNGTEKDFCINKLDAWIVNTV